MSNTFSKRSLSIPLIKSPNSSIICLNKHDTRSPTSLSCFLTAVSNSGSGMPISSRPSFTSLLTSSMTTPLMLAVSPVSFFCMRCCVRLISYSRSTTLPVCLSINSSISFFSIPRANFINSAIGPSSFVAVSDPHLPLPTWTVTFCFSVAAFCFSLSVFAAPRSFLVSSVPSSFLCPSLFVGASSTPDSSLV